VLGYPHARGGHHERRNRRNIERRKPVSTGAAGVQQRLAIQSRIDCHSHLPHGAGEPHQLVDGFPFHAQGHQKTGNLGRACLAVQDAVHGFQSFRAGEVLTVGHAMQVGQKRHAIVGC
jgi:hypothetical protein